MVTEIKATPRDLRVAIQEVVEALRVLSLGFVALAGHDLEAVQQWLAQKNLPWKEGKHALQFGMNAQDGCVSCWGEDVEIGSDGVRMISSSSVNSRHSCSIVVLAGDPPELRSVEWVESVRDLGQPEVIKRRVAIAFAKGRIASVQLEYPESPAPQ